MSKLNKDYHDEVNIKNTVKLRELLNEFPDFCKLYFRGIENNTASRTRLSYAYDLRVFFDFIKSHLPDYKDVNIKELKLEFLDKLTRQDIEAYME